MTFRSPMSARKAGRCGACGVKLAAALVQYGMVYCNSRCFDAVNVKRCCGKRKPADLMIAYVDNGRIPGQRPCDREPVLQIPPDFWMVTPSILLYCEEHYAYHVKRALPRDKL